MGEESRVVGNQRSQAPTSVQSLGLFDRKQVTQPL